MKKLTGVVAAGALASTAAVSGCGVVGFGTHHKVQSYNAPAGIDALRVTETDGRVEIVASDSPGIAVQERLSWSNAKNKPKARHTTEGRTLTLSGKCAHGVIGTSSCGVSYRVRVPRATAVQVDNADGAVAVSGLGGTLRLFSDNGTITARDLRTASLTARTGDGSIRVSGRAATASLHADTGEITATGLTADRLTARTQDGRIRLTGRANSADLSTDTGSIVATGLTAKQVAARTDDGSIRLSLLDPPDTVRARTDTGSVRLTLPGEAGYAFGLTTDTGGRHIGPEVRQDPRSPRSVTITTGDGSIAVSGA